MANHCRVFAALSCHFTQMQPFLIISSSSLIQCFICKMAYLRVTFPLCSPISSPVCYSPSLSAWWLAVFQVLSIVEVLNNQGNWGDACLCCPKLVHFERSVALSFCVSVTISVSLFVDPGKVGAVVCTCSSKSFSSFASCLS